MKTEALSILTFLIAFLCYGFVGLLWLLYDSAFVTATTVSSTSIQSSSLVLAAKIQTAAFLALLGATATGLLDYWCTRFCHVFGCSTTWLALIDSGDYRRQRFPRHCFT